MPSQQRFVVETIDEHHRVGSRSWLETLDAVKAYTDRLVRVGVLHEVYELRPVQVQHSAIWL